MYLGANSTNRQIIGAHGGPNTRSRLRTSVGGTRKVVVVGLSRGMPQRRLGQQKRDTASLPIVNEVIEILRSIAGRCKVVTCQIELIVRYPRTRVNDTQAVLAVINVANSTIRLRCLNCGCDSMGSMVIDLVLTDLLRSTKAGSSGSLNGKQ